MSAPDASNSFYAKDRKAWRRWLQQNGARKSSVWLILYRKSSATPSLTYDEAVEDALCYGWVDSKPNKRDGESYYLYFAQRKPKSNWSKPNKDRVEKLLAQGLMTPAGIAAVEVAKANGAWTALDKVDALELPADLLKALAANKTANRYFNAFPPSAKKGILEWIGNAKREATRAGRIAETVRLAAQNQRANQYTPKQN